MPKVPAPTPASNPYTGGFPYHTWEIGYERGYVEAQKGLSHSPGRASIGLIGVRASQAEVVGYDSGYSQFWKEQVYLEG